MHSTQNYCLPAFFSPFLKLFSKDITLICVALDFNFYFPNHILEEKQMSETPIKRANVSGRLFITYKVYNPREP